jgi:hypothetical protein
LHVDPDDIDAHRFEMAVGPCRTLARDDPVAASRDLSEVLALWRGNALEGFAYDEFAQAEIARLEENRLAATEGRIDADLRSGLHRDTIGELVGIAREYPLRERPVSLLMTLSTAPVDKQTRSERSRYIRARSAKSLASSRLPSCTGSKSRFSCTTRAWHRWTRPVRPPATEIRNLLALIGASGSGRSSVLRAGLIPAIRKGAVGDPDSWLIAQMVPGARPFTELEAALLRSTLDSPDGLAELLDHTEDGLVRAAPRLFREDSGRLLLVIDQFEELFTLVESEEERSRFIRNLEVALSDPHGRTVVVIALRADFYDRPLEHATFANLLSEGVVNTVPLSPDELEAAAERPAAMAGAQLEPTLLSRLLTDVAGQSGGLPLFQYALTELFDRRSGTLLTANVYQEMGGVQGVITRRVGELYQTFDADEQQACKQLFLMLVTIIDAEAWSRRRVAASEIVTIAVDTVDLQTVLDRFGSFRLLTFDRDHGSGSPTVEVAHEALLWEWGRLRGWIEDGREDLLRHARFTTAFTEWRASGDKVGYLLSGERLADYEQWAGESTLRLSTPEQHFLDASIDQREKQIQSEAQRSVRESKVDRQSRRRLWGLAGGGALFAAVAIGILIAVFGGGSPRIVLVHGVTGDFGINDLMIAGADAVECELDIEIERVEPLIDPEADERTIGQSDTVVGSEL